MKVLELREKILDFAQRDENVRAVIETGAFARQHPPADELSDLDIELYARQPELLRQSNAWFEAFGPIWVFLSLENDVYNPTRLVIYEGGAKVDFALYDAARLEEKLPSQAQERGFQVRLDKDGLLRDWQVPAATLGVKPAVEVWNQCRTDFWFEAYNLARYLARGDLWHAKVRDAELKEYLLQMLEWHASATRGAELWHLGHFLEKWVDETTLQEVKGVWAGFDTATNFRALNSMLDLFGRISREVATIWELPMEGVEEEGIRRFIEKTRKKVAIGR